MKKTTGLVVMFFMALTTSAFAEGLGDDIRNSFNSLATTTYKTVGSIPKALSGLNQSAIKTFGATSNMVMIREKTTQETIKSDDAIKTRALNDPMLNLSVKVGELFRVNKSANQTSGVLLELKKTSTEPKDAVSYPSLISIPIKNRPKDPPPEVMDEGPNFMGSNNLPPTTTSNPVATFNFAKEVIIPQDVHLSDGHMKGIDARGQLQTSNNRIRTTRDLTPMQQQNLRYVLDHPVR
ncbi:MAG: hypothetical protein NTY14_05415 [Candidatus Omnitrophica bacterium]|nr:hypothetical protein [Candidatus Omnitrophota bacterium]